MGRLDGKAAIVTGAGQGIGRGVARAFAREGAAVTVAEINGETGRAVARELEDELGARALFVETDVLDREQVARMVDATVETFERVDVLVNNAYVAGATSMASSGCRPRPEKRRDKRPHFVYKMRGRRDKAAQISRGAP